MPHRNSNERETLALRLVAILRKLNDGKKLCPRELADELGTNIRTIQRDLNDRFGFLGLEKVDGRYSLPTRHLGRLTTEDMNQFAALAGVRGLFPTLNDRFYAELFQTRTQTTWLVKGAEYEPLNASKTILFQQLEDAIRQRQAIDYSYDKPDGTKTYQGVHPYKLVNHDGIWYLAAKDSGALKSFTLVKMDRLQLQNSHFTPDPEVERTLQQEDDVWLKEKKQEIVLKVTGLAATYFRRRKHVPQQEISKEMEDGGLIVSCRVAHEDQIFRTVRQWLPHIRIISPEGLQTKLERELLQYVEQR
ncbi:MAG: WYL domain-containing transcriptional regulator [Burkholderiales bacterium]|nr:WYL domain-containing transcriptional regulator [Burkholderiales bacterium]